jgi:hypothetical protein
MWYPGFKVAYKFNLYRYNEAAVLGEPWTRRYVYNQSQCGRWGRTHSRTHSRVSDWIEVHGPCCLRSSTECVF